MKINYLKMMFLIFIVLSAGPDVFAKDRYAFIKSNELNQMNRVISGFVESFPDAETSLLNLKGKKDADKVRTFIRKTRPSVIVCLGSLAAKTAIQVEKRIPIIFSMVINHSKYHILNQGNATGISMEIPPESLFTQFRMLVPHVRSIGVPFHPEGSAEIVNDALYAARKIGLQVVRIKVLDPNDMREKLSDYEKRCSGLWMLADTKLYNRRTRAFYDLLSFAKEKKKPLLAFSEAFLKPGAFFSISIDYRSLGSQIALVSRQIVQDNVRPSGIPVARPIGTYTVINRDVAQQLLGRDLDESIYDDADKVYPE